MPIYEYEPVERDCFICENKLDILQGISEEAFKKCPHCGLDVKRIVSKAAIKIERPKDFDKAGQKGFTTYKRAEKGVWEKVAGDGADYMVGSQEDIQAVEAEKQAPAKVLDLDKTD